MTQMCSGRAAARRGVEFASKSNPDKTYKAYAFRDGELPMCTCMPFMTGRKKKAKELGCATNEAPFECSHLKKLLADACAWHAHDPHDGGIRIDGLCPRCGQLAVDDDEELNVDPSMGLEALVAQLTGKGAAPMAPPPPVRRVAPTITAGVKTEPDPNDATVTVTSEAVLTVDGQDVVGVVWDEHEPDDPTIVLWNREGATVATVPVATILALTADTPLLASDAGVTAAALLASLSP